MKENRIVFIGAGNMAAALINGLVQDGYPSGNITAADPDEQKTAHLHECCGISTATDNNSAVMEADIVVLAVKPQVLPEVAKSISSTVRQKNPLVISIAAGIQTAHLEKWLGEGTALIRTMPNTPAMLQAGTTALFATESVSEEQRNHAESIMRAVGLALWITGESQMDAVTAVSGSGPAYFFLFMEQMIAAARELGIDDETARLLTLHTALGAARMALENPDDPSTLRSKVTSPGGTTAAAIETFENGGLRKLVAAALTAARDRSIELSSLVDK